MGYQPALSITLPNGTDIGCTGQIALATREVIIERGFPSPMRPEIGTERALFSRFRGGLIIGPPLCVGLTPASVVPKNQKLTTLTLPRQVVLELQPQL